MLIMPNFKILGWITVVFLLPAALYPAAAGIQNLEIDLEGIANNVIDGDTFDMTASNGTQYRIRLADVDAPERYEEGYAESGEYLRGLVSGESVYLDIDDLYVWDDHGNGNRLVGIIYINYNSSYLLNVNEALFQAGHLLKKEYDNEFTPYNWSLYVSIQESPEFPSTIIAVVAIAALLLALTFTRRRQHMTEKHSNNR
jgi:endonuclease YncB( thermonuclease family)